jgi:hypothetical protein
VHQFFDDSNIDNWKVMKRWFQEWRKYDEAWFSRWII